MLKLSSVTLLRVLKEYGDPAALAADPGAAERLASLGRSLAVRRRRSSGCWPARPRAWGSGSGTGNGARSGMTRGGRWRRGRRPGGAVAVARAGRGECGPAGPRQGRGGGDGVCLVDEHGGPDEVSCGGGLPQGDGIEPGGAEQRPLSGAAADQQAGQCAVAAMALFRGAAAGAARRRASLVRGQEGR